MVKTISADPAVGRLVVEVEYLDGVAAAASYEHVHAAHLCEHTLACGGRIGIDISSTGVALDTSEVDLTVDDSSSLVLIKVLDLRPHSKSSSKHSLKEQPH